MRKKKEVVKGYKGFDGNLCCRGYQYEVGKTFEVKGQIGICDWGLHFCRNLFSVNNYYPFDNDSCRFCEVEAVGEVIDSDDGDKSVTNKLKIVREIPREEFIQMANTGVKNSGFCNTGDWNTGDYNTGDWNTGDYNTGNRNTGDYNTGDYNTGNRNTGNRNTGDYNTGNRNTGNWNTGDYNTGNCNTGDYNTGNCNTGNRNTGNWNTGDYNTGNCNTGDYNTGNCNTGDWNTGDWNKTNRSSGVFCTEEPKLILFNKETDMTFEEWRNTRAYDLLCDVEKSKWICFDDMSAEEKEKFPSAETCGGYLKELSRKEASKSWWNNLDDYDKNELFGLPNFDLKIFNEIMELDIKKTEYKKVVKNVNL